MDASEGLSRGVCRQTLDDPTVTIEAANLKGAQVLVNYVGGDPE